MRKSSPSGMNPASTKPWPSLNGPTTTARTCRRSGQRRAEVWRVSPGTQRPGNFMTSSRYERNNSMHASLFHDLIIHGEDLFHTGYMHEALQVFESVLAEEPQNILALNNRGVILHRLGMYAAAKQTFLDILRQVDANANAVVNLGSMYIEQYIMHNTEELLGRYGKCLSIQDINEFKEELHEISQAIQTFNTSEKTKILRVSMDVQAKNHVFESYLNEQEPTHRVMCTCFANNALYQ